MSKGILVFIAVALICLIGVTGLYFLLTDDREKHPAAEIIDEYKKLMDPEK